MVGALSAPVVIVYESTLQGPQQDLQPADTGPTTSLSDQDPSHQQIKACTLGNSDFFTFKLGPASAIEQQSHPNGLVQVVVHWRGGKQPPAGTTILTGEGDGTLHDAVVTLVTPENTRDGTTVVSITTDPVAKRAASQYAGVGTGTSPDYSHPASNQFDIGPFAEWSRVDPDGRVSYASHHHVRVIDCAIQALSRSVAYAGSDWVHRQGGPTKLIKALERDGVMPKIAQQIVESIPNRPTRALHDARLLLKDRGPKATPAIQAVVEAAGILSYLDEGMKTYLADQPVAHSPDAVLGANTAAWAEGFGSGPRPFGSLDRDAYSGVRLTLGGITTGLDRLDHISATRAITDALTPG